MKVIFVDRGSLLIRFADLKPGEAFIACGDVAIKTVDGKAVVLCDGNYVHRDPNDIVTPAHADVRVTIT